MAYSESKPSVAVAVVGLGLVGSELLQQLQEFNSNVVSAIKLISISNSKRTLSSFGDGLSFSRKGWQSELASKGVDSSSSDLFKQLIQYRASHSNDTVVLIDNTSSEEIAASYPSYLKEGIHIITPNKKAFSGSQKLYDEIRSTSSSTGTKFLHESTVGAGLPIINTLKILIATGDKVRKIEGVFSGTLSYIFNEFSTVSGSGGAFSSVVRVAREKGYTEPHPGDDLDGSDVARKLTILSRLISANNDHLPEGYRSVKTASLVPGQLADVKFGDEFLDRLPQFDSHFANLRQKASAAGKVLRYVGVIDVSSKTVEAELADYDKTHPFATSLGGSDNIVMFHTERYNQRPLIIQGSGAGAAVTAMGVMGDLLQFL